MKKLLLLAAFAGLVGSNAFASTYGDDKDKKTKKECCSKGDKGCAGDKKDASAKDNKSCCKKKDASADANKTDKK